jgi:6,7-dimethyl-8-ribityllumazine synthase
MLKKNRSKALSASPRGAQYAIIASKYNAKFVDSMLKAAREELAAAGAADVRVYRVPGAYEVPIAAKTLAACPAPPSAIICLGVILRGETVHAAHIGDAVSRSLMEIQLAHQVPVIHEVLLLENKEQARVRCLSPEHNRGREAAQTAIAMAALMPSLQSAWKVPASAQK